jgi:adenylate cyclase, class 2
LSCKAAILPESQQRAAGRRPSPFAALLDRPRGSEDQFARANEPRQRESRYRIVVVDDGLTLRDALEAAVGVRVVVTKRRRLHLWRGVRIHLDDVEGLGTFIELEAVAPPQSDLTREHQLILQLRKAFDITDERLVSLGYADQLLS